MLPGDDNTAIYNYDLTLADEGLYKLWRDGAGGWYTVEKLYWDDVLEGEYATEAGVMTFTCRANDSWDDLSDEC